MLCKKINRKECLSAIDLCLPETYSGHRQQGFSFPKRILIQLRLKKKQSVKVDNTNNAIQLYHPLRERKLQNQNNLNKMWQELLERNWSQLSLRMDAGKTERRQLKDQWRFKSQSWVEVIWNLTRFYFANTSLKCWLNNLSKSLSTNSSLNWVLGIFVKS